jgi:hypothetical protein
VNRTGIHSRQALATALATSALAAATLVGVDSAHAAESQVVSLGACAFGTGNASVTPGVPVSLRLPGFAQGTRGLITDFLHKERTTLSVAAPGGTTQNDLTDTWASPQKLDTHFWLSRPSNADIGSLAPGTSVLVTEQITFDGPLLVAFPPVGPSGDNGPFLISAEDPVSCTITAE